MLWTIINEADVFYSPKSICENNAVRSSDPYSYIKTGYHLDNAGLFGGIDNVDVTPLLRFDYAAPRI